MITDTDSGEVLGNESFERNVEFIKSKAKDRALFNEARRWAVGLYLTLLLALTIFTKNETKALNEQAEGERQ